MHQGPFTFIGLRCAARESSRCISMETFTRLLIKPPLSKAGALRGDADLFVRLSVALLPTSL